ncbi:diguanylate cyclase [Zavarzinia sp. CC-PAN008]|uniref:GGDEF domain-containing protein n=1 Tax=Zavarzinia sp. CC-PAN008 TaxID=3243332 RepID=UPI003F746850
MVDAARQAPPPHVLPSPRQVRDALVVGAVVLAAALAGILARPLGLLSDLWPANAVLMGLMLRAPRLAGVSCWSAAFCGFVAADLLTGSALAMTLWLTLANLAGVAVTVGLFQLRPAADRRLARPSSVLVMFAILVLSAAAAGTIGGVAGPVFFAQDLVPSIFNWFTAELVASSIILPVLLTFPRLPVSRPGGLARALHGALRGVTPGALAPAVSVVLATACATLLGGPGAIAFQVPALLWCAVSYRLPVTVVLTMAASLVLTMAGSLGTMNVFPVPDTSAMISFRLGIALLVLGPLMVGSIQAARAELLLELRHAADHDALTGVLGRSAFLRQGQETVAALAREQRPFAVLMFDLDGFKAVNDGQGHAAGDALLRLFARTVQRTLRRGDLIGRLGGDEFVALLPDVDGDEAQARAEQMRRAVADAPPQGDGRDRAPVTASIGLVHSDEGHAFRDDARLRELLLLADKALYRAKHAGRNRVATVRRPLPAM